MKFLLSAATPKIKTGLIFREKTDTKKSVNDVLGKNKTKYKSYFKIRTPAVESSSPADMEKEVLDYFNVFVDFMIRFSLRSPFVVCLL